MNNLFVISGPSGVGKTSLVDILLTAYQGRAVRPITNTSRAPRPGEVNGVHYHFRTRKEFVAMIEAGEFVEHAEVHGNLYGTTKESLAAIGSGQFGILIVDCEGASNVRKIYPNCTAIFIKVPKEILRERLVKRGTDSTADIELRLKNAAAELQRARDDYFDYVIENVSFYTAYQHLVSAIMAGRDGRCRPSA